MAWDLRTLSDVDVKDALPDDNPLCYKQRDKERGRLVRKAPLTAKDETPYH